MRFGVKVGRQRTIYDTVLRKFSEDVLGNLCNYGYEVTLLHSAEADVFKFVGLDAVDLKFLDRDFRQAIKDAIDQSLNS